MASKVPNLGGLDFDFVDEPPDSLKCLICMLVVNEPWQHGECGRVFCRICMEEYGHIKDTCPNCRRKRPTLFRDGRSEKDVNALIVRCGCSDKDELDTCMWTGELGDRKYHHSTCPLQTLPCPNECTENGERVEITRKYLQKHLEDDCLKRQHKCPHCNEEGTYLERVTTHQDTCPKASISCPNTPCDKVTTRGDMEEHIRTECLHGTISCLYSDIGCLEKLSRSDMKEHLLDVTLHMEAAKMTITALRKCVHEHKDHMIQQEQQMKRELAIASSRVYLMKNGQKTFKMSNFSMYKSTNKEFKSAPFYTGNRGYKMCIIVEANRISKVKGACVSIYAHLMKGEYDDKLSWPLVGTVTFELLNQLGNHNHQKKSCTFPSDDKDNHRVFDREIADAGYGCPRFMSHAKLGVDGGGSVQYLKDDCLYFRISVEAPDPLDHNWLKCY